MTLEELKKEIRPLDETSMEQAREHWIKIAKPLFSLGKLEDAVIQMAGIKETPDYELKKKALVIMCADNGIVEEGVTQTGQEVTAIVADNFTSCFLLFYLLIPFDEQSGRGGSLSSRHRNGGGCSVSDSQGRKSCLRNT
jgi:NaMN:DMB phosphoribosyltransferase